MIIEEIRKAAFAIKGGIADLIDKLELAKIEKKEISNDEVLERLNGPISMIRPNLEKSDKSKYPSFNIGVLPKTKKYVKHINRKKLNYEHVLFLLIVKEKIIFLLFSIKIIFI